MPGLLHHSPAAVIRKLFVDAGYGSEVPSLGGVGAWPVYAASEPTSPDNVITILDSDDDAQHGRTMIDGERQEHHAVRVQVRAATHTEGYAKARALAVALDEDVYQRTVQVGSTEYLVHCLNRTNDISAAGKNPPTDKRSSFSFIARVSLRMVSP